MESSIYTQIKAAMQNVQTLEPHKPGDLGRIQYTLMVLERCEANLAELAVENDRLRAEKQHTQDVWSFLLQKTEAEPGPDSDFGYDVIFAVRLRSLLQQWQQAYEAKE